LKRWTRAPVSSPAGPDDGLYFLHTDHLGSTTLLTDENGGQVGGLTRYYPYGGYRGAPGSDLTDMGYTGHRGNMDLGLIYMNARYYVPASTALPRPIPSRPSRPTRRA
jgi:hypothetical protein